MADFDTRFKSNTVEWPTPPELYLPLHAEFGFDVDVAATAENAKCANYWTKEQDGLLQPWGKCNWMNPPYGKDVPKWLKRALQESKIELPLMYRLGYDNANCIGCVKGGEGYWRAIREDFPAEFEELATVQDELGEGAHLFRNRATGERYSLRDLGAGPVRRNEKLPACSFFCELAEQEYAA